MQHDEPADRRNLRRGDSSGGGSGRSPGRKPSRQPRIRDRIVQTALLYVIEPIFEYSFHEHSYGFRPGRSARQAVDRVEELLGAGNTWVVDADIKG